jgi:tetratricopeptide (TPR) repeat protein
MNKLLKIVLWIGAGLALILIGTGIWGYRKGYYHAMRGGFAQSEGRLDDAIGYFKQAYAKNPNAFMVAHDLACCYSLKDDRKNCFLWLRKALETDHRDYVRKSARKEVDFANVRDDAEFKTLIESSPPKE